MLVKSVFAGFGGQGILRMGYILGTAAMFEDKHVTYLPAYGAEMRGGTANCTVAVSDEEIASPIASSPENAVVMNLPSLAKFQNLIKPGGRIFVNETLIEEKPFRDDVEVFGLGATGAADEMGDIRAANMVMLGYFIGVTGLAGFENIAAAMKENFAGRDKAIEFNAKALSRGYEAAGGGA